jgi:hypothetical protein
LKISSSLAATLDNSIERLFNREEKHGLVSEYSRFAIMARADSLLDWQKNRTRPNSEPLSVADMAEINVRTASVLERVERRTPEDSKPYAVSNIAEFILDKEGMNASPLPQFDFSTLLEFLKVAKFYREELFSLKAKTTEPMIAYVLEHASHLIDSDAKKNCKNIRSLFATEKIIVEHEKEIEHQLNRLINEKNSGMQRAIAYLFEDCYIHYQFVDKKLLLKKELFLEELFRVVRTNVEEAELKIQSIENFNDEKLALAFVGALCMIVQQASHIVENRSEMLKVVEEKNKDEPFYIRATAIAILNQL